MVFSSITFIFVFLPIFLTLYYTTPEKWRNLTALIGSYVFYAWGAPTFVYILFASSLFDYLLSLGLKNKGKRKQILALSIIVNIGVLAYAKYANFFVSELNRSLSLLGADGFHWTHIALPIGISFFTFQKISYMVDIYRGEVKPPKSFIDFALYVALFPQLIAGPIVRYHDIAKQLVKRAYTSEQFFSGIYRFTLGLSKKVLIANPMGITADRVFSLSMHDLTTPYAWLGATAYAFQIYFDFSGYSDMAIGLGKMMGFNFLENFNRPYIATSFTDFWRRWHISLSSWMREYLYIPLGGNRVGKKRMYTNLWIVFLLSGLWHGAAWTFVIWGAYHGLFLVLDKLGLKKLLDRLPQLISTPLTFLLVTVGWVFFRSDTIAGAQQFLMRMFYPIKTLSDTLLVELISNRGIIVFIIAMVISFAPNIFAKLNWQKSQLLLARAVTILVLFSLSTMSLLNSSFNPFIYFRF
jgi:alginate O-acetyltransferase complex protein AlgI